MLARRLAALTLFFLERPAPLARKLFLHQHRHARARARSLAVTTTRREHGGPRSTSNPDSPAGGPPSRKAAFLKRTSSRDEQRGPSVEDASTSAGASRPTEAQECDPGQTQSPQTFAQRREAEAEGETHQMLGTCECCEEKDPQPEQDAGAKNSENQHQRQHEAAPTAAQKDENKTETEKDEDEGCKLTQDMEKDGMVKPVPLQGKTKFEKQDGSHGPIQPYGPAKQMCTGSTDKSKLTHVDGQSVEGQSVGTSAAFEVTDRIGKIRQLTLTLPADGKYDVPLVIKAGSGHNNAMAKTWEEGPRIWVDKWIDEKWQPVLPEHHDSYTPSKKFDGGTVVEDPTSTKLHFRPKKPLEPGKYRFQSGKKWQHGRSAFCFELLVCGDGPKGR